MTKARNANGEGTIHYDPERDRWVGRITIGLAADGKPIRRKFVAKTRAEVRRRMEAARRATEQGMPVPNERLTVSQYLDRWLSTLHGRVTEATEYLYSSRVRLYLVPVLGHVPLTKLTPGHVTGLLATMEAKGLAPDTQRHTRAVLRTALRKAEQEGLVTRNVAAIADGPRVSRPEGRTLTNAEADALLAAAAASPSRRPGSPGRRSEAFERLEPAIVLGLYLGLRKGEILGLRWDDIDLDSPLPLLNVRQQLVRRPNGLGLGLTEPKTPKSKRSVHLPDRVVAALRTQRARQGRDRLAMGSEWKDTWGLVFTTQTGTPVDPRNFNRVFSKIAMSAGLGHWHPHELRHSTASLMLAEGVPLEVVSVVLGHASIRTTKDTYGHVLPNMLATAAQAMDRALS